MKAGRDECGRLPYCRATASHSRVSSAAEHLTITTTVRQRRTTKKNADNVDYDSALRNAPPQRQRSAPQRLNHQYSRTNVTSFCNYGGGELARRWSLMVVYRNSRRHRSKNCENGGISRPPLCHSSMAAARTVALCYLLLSAFCATTVGEQQYLTGGGGSDAVAARLHPITPADAHSPPALVSTASPEAELVDQIESIDVTAHEIIILTSKVGPPDLLHVAITVVDIENWNELPPINLTGIFILVTRGRYTINFLAPNRWYGVVFRCEQRYARGGVSLAPPPPPNAAAAAAGITLGGELQRVVNEEQHLVKTHKEDGSHLDAQPLVRVTTRRFSNGGKSLENLVITIKWEQHPSERPNLDAMANVTLFCKQHIKYKQLRLYGRELEKSVEVKLDNHFEIMELYNETRQIIASITPKNCPRICWNVELVAETPRGVQFRRAATRDCETIAAVSAATNLREYVGYELVRGNLRIRTNYSEPERDDREADAYVQLVAVGLPEAKPRDNSTVRFKTYGTASDRHNKNDFLLENLEAEKMYAIEYKYGKESPFAYAESRRFVVETPAANHDRIISSDALDGPGAPIHRQWPVRVIVERVPVKAYLLEKQQRDAAAAAAAAASHKHEHRAEAAGAAAGKEEHEAALAAAALAERAAAKHLSDAELAAAKHSSSDGAAKHSSRDGAAKFDAERLPEAVRPVNADEERSTLWRLEMGAREKLSDALSEAQRVEHKLAAELGEGAAKLGEGAAQLKADATRLVDDAAAAVRHTAADWWDAPAAVQPVNWKSDGSARHKRATERDESEEFALHAPKIIMQLDANFEDYEIGVDLEPFCELSHAAAHASHAGDDDDDGDRAREDDGADKENEAIDAWESGGDREATADASSKRGKSHFWLTRDHPNRELRHLDVVGAVCGAQPGHALCRLHFAHAANNSGDAGRCAHDAKLCYTPSIRVRGKLYAMDRRCVDVAKRLATQIAADEAEAKSALPPTTAHAQLAAADEARGNRGARNAFAFDALLLALGGGAALALFSNGFA